MNPSSGGSYTRDSDGNLTLVTPGTGERPCKCREDHEQAVETVVDIPPANVVPPSE